MLLKKLFHKHLATPFLLWIDPRRGGARKKE